MPVRGRLVELIAAAAVVVTVLAAGATGSACDGPSRPASSAATTRTGQQYRSATTVTGAPGTAAPGAEPMGSPGCGTSRNPGEAVESLESGGVTRTYRVYVPTGYDPAVPLPLVLNFHGSSRTGAGQEQYSGLVPLADEQRFILVSPDGLDEQWTIADDDDPSAVTSVDVAFTSDLLAQLRAELCIDNLRVYATGMSNGAEMASQVGCLLPGDFAAIAPVAGVEYAGCSGDGMPVLAFHGTADENVPFDTAEPAMADWAEHNHCSGGPVTAAVSEHVSTETYAGCDADVVLYVIDGGGHTWPGAEDDVPYGGAGPTTHEIDASALIWAFFAAHPKRG